ncbi:MAG: ATP-binding protein [Limnobacter sp.]|nr:ATP-binding protein [Limnobacter sp.]
MQKPKKSRSFISQMIFISMLGLILLAAPLALFGHYYLGKQALSNAEKDLNGRGKRFAIMLSTQFRETLRLLEVSSQTLQGIDGDTEVQLKAKQMITALAKVNPGMLWIGLTNPQGEVIVSRQNFLEGRDVSKRPWFQKGLNGSTIMDVHEAVLLAKLLPPKADGPYRFIDFAVPFEFKDQAKGVLGVHIDWDWLLKEVIYRYASNSNGVEYLVVTQGGDLRVSTTPEWYKPANIAQLKDQIGKVGDQAKSPAKLTLVTDGGTTREFIYKRIPTTETPELESVGWEVIAIIDHATLGRPITDSLLFGLLAMVLGAVVTLALVAQSGKKLSKAAERKLHELGQSENLSDLLDVSTMPSEMVPIATKAHALLADLKSKSDKLANTLAFTQEQYWIIGALVRQAPVPIAMMDQERRYIASSTRWNEEILDGLPHTEGLAHTAVLRNLPERWRLAETRGLRGESAHGTDEPWETADGKVRYVNWAIEPWRKPDGAQGGLIIMAEDVTFQHQIQKQLVESEERFKLAVEGLDDGLWDWEIDKREIYFSPNWKKMLGYEDHELRNSVKTWRNLIHPEDIDRVESEFKLCLSTHRQMQFSTEFRMQHQGGAWLSILSRARVLRHDNGHAYRMVGSHVDRTTAIELEEELREALVSARAEQEANQAKSQFVATVSHEIRNPLNGVVGFAHLLHQDLPEGESKTNARYLMQTAESLSLILTDLLDHAKMEAGHLSLQKVPTNVADLVQSVSAMSRIACESKGIHFRVECDLPFNHLLVDPVRLRQVIQNLLSNAVKFTASGGIELLAKMESPSESAGTNKLVVRVTDTGAGIPEHKRSDLFKPFSQLHTDPQNKLGGTGLGLSIVNNLVDLMDGTLSYMPNTPRGSVFEIRMPVRAEDKATVNPGASMEQPSAKTRQNILIVDDSGFNLRILNAVLEKAGHQVTQAQSGIDALKLAKERAFDFMMIDLEMPDLSGIEVVKTIRAERGPNQQVRIACLSGREDPKDIQNALNSGFDCYFTKPLKFDHLLQAVLTIRDKSLEKITP